MRFDTGRVVISSAGHDAGRFMVVTGADGGFVYVADGKERKLESPKKKNIKHVRYTESRIEPSELTNKKLRQTLRALATKSTLQESE